MLGNAALVRAGALAPSGLELLRAEVLVAHHQDVKRGAKARAPST